MSTPAHNVSTGMNAFLYKYQRPPLGACGHLVVVLVEVGAVLQEGLHVVNELPAEVGLQGDQLVLHLRAAGQQLLPGVAQCVHLLHLLLGHGLPVLVEHGVGLLEGEVNDEGISEGKETMSIFLAAMQLIVIISYFFIIIVKKNGKEGSLILFSCLDILSKRNRFVRVYAAFRKGF